MNKEVNKFNLTNSQNETVVDFKNATIENPVFIFPPEDEKKKFEEFKESRKDIRIRKINYTNKETKIFTTIIIGLILYPPIIFYYGLNSISISISILIFFVFYFTSLIIHRWFLDKGFLKYKKEKIVLTYNNIFEEINYSDISKIKKEKSFISGTSFFLYTRDDEKAKIKFNFYNYSDVMDFENKLEKESYIKIENI